MRVFEKGNKSICLINVGGPEDDLRRLFLGGICFVFGIERFRNEYNKILRFISMRNVIGIGRTQATNSFLG